MSTWAEIKGRKKGRVKKVPVIMDATIADRIDELKAEIREQERIDRRTNEPDKAPGMKLELEKLIDEAREETVVFTFKAMGNRVWEKEIIEAFPPREEDTKAGLVFNAEAAAPLAIAKSCIDPEMTLEDAEELWNDDEWNQGELAALWFAVIDVNTNKADIPFSDTDSLTTQSSTTPSNTA